MSLINRRRRGIVLLRNSSLRVGSMDLDLEFAYMEFSRRRLRRKNLLYKLLVFLHNLRFIFAD